MLVLMKAVIILVIILLYYKTMQNYIETFNIIPNNKIFNQTNKTNSLKDRHTIDSINTDINVQTDLYFYELSNAKYLDNLNSIFKIEKTTDINSEWIFNIDDGIKGVYDKAYQHISNKLSVHNHAIQIVHDKLNKYKQNDNKYIMDIDMILYRTNKMNGKHVNFIMYIDFINVSIFNIEIKGIVGEDKIGFFPIEPYNVTMNHDVYDEII